MSSAALPQSCSCLTALFRGQLFSVDDWRCNGHSTPKGQQEWCAQDRIVFTRRGVWQLSVQGQSQLNDPLHATFWRGGAEFRVDHPLAGGDDCTVLRLTEAAMQRFALTRCGTALKSRFSQASLALSAMAYRYSRALLDLARAGAGALQLEEQTMALLTELDVIDDPDSHTSVKQDLRKRAVAEAYLLIAQRYRENLPLAEIADAVHASVFHLSRQFKRSTGMSLHQAQTQWRLRAGMERVLDQPSQLTDIAHDLGFASLSHFSDAFKQAFKCSPHQARAHYRALRV
jgi:AraC family transcriptional regulator